jgi:hypothetical protein
MDLLKDIEQKADLRMKDAQRGFERLDADLETSSRLMSTQDERNAAGHRMVNSIIGSIEELALQIRSQAEEILKASEPTTGHMLVNTEKDLPWLREKYASWQLYLPDNRWQ